LARKKHLAYTVQKAHTANHSSQSIKKISAIIELSIKQARIRREEIYIAKALRIGRWKKVKLKNFKKQKNSVVRRSTVQGQELICSRFQRSMQKLPINVNDKERLYKQEMSKVNKELQGENELRMNKMQGYKRKQILNTHREIQERINKRKKEMLANDCYIRRQTVINNRSKQQAYNTLHELVKKDITKESKRALLIKQLKEWNKKFDLHVKLIVPKKLKPTTNIK